MLAVTRATQRVLCASGASRSACGLARIGPHVMSAVPPIQLLMRSEKSEDTYMHLHDAQDVTWQQRKASATGFFVGRCSLVRSFARLASMDQLKVTKLLRMNEKITAPMVRFVELDGSNEILKIGEAIRKAREANLDLVEVSPNTDPPVVRLMDYSKHRFEKKRRESVKKADAKRSGVLKEVRFTSRISENDLNTKMGTIEKFLLKGYKVQVIVMGKAVSAGAAGQEEGVLLLQHAIQMVAHVCKVDREPGKDKSGRVTATLQGIPGANEGDDSSVED
mmetsp:Transcript_15989/g.26995  ORF Transcript_15989/g.26995 Transcript_15989/m.26995 type:complete len:278 (-) Transcript_15989:469-1302(-)